MFTKLQMQHVLDMFKNATCTVSQFVEYTDKEWYWFQNGATHITVDGIKIHKSNIVNVINGTRYQTFRFDLLNPVKDTHSNADERKVRNKNGESINGIPNVTGIYIFDLEMFLVMEYTFTPVKGIISAFPSDKVVFPYKDYFVINN